MSEDQKVRNLLTKIAELIYDGNRPDLAMSDFIGYSQELIDILDSKGIFDADIKRLREFEWIFLAYIGSYRKDLAGKYPQLIFQAVKNEIASKFQGIPELLKSHIKH